ncbi:MAG: hypothetical protein IJP96_05260 [Synergistaceae bacterium]|nr:hypothetical protein [Synergistaceae bacterium]MBQ6738282.1 hypothetical protein [Synergistaceae bacterium]MBR0075140.1 hypothetical protein [Synergistaceae bacterium]MBR0234695.1 hypothetical protein [Synergistaceae bacterium]MBR0316856.1 hypothetical protein [Synergistaceae bacterium]
MEILVMIIGIIFVAALAYFLFGVALGILYDASIFFSDIIQSLKGKKKDNFTDEISENDYDEINDFFNKNI